MTFRDAEIKYTDGKTIIYHDNWDDCKDLPWDVKTVTCLPHEGATAPHPLDEEKWDISDYNRTEKGYSATLTLRQLDLGSQRDLHLKQQFDRGGKLKLKIAFNSPKSAFLSLKLKP
jgi:hypothetical protein